MGPAVFITAMTPSRVTHIASRSMETVPICRATTPGQARLGVRIQIPSEIQPSTTELIPEVVRGAQPASLLVGSFTVTSYDPD